MASEVVGQMASGAALTFVGVVAGALFVRWLVSKLIG